MNALTTALPLNSV